MKLYFRGKRLTLKAGNVRMPDGSLSYKEIVLHPGAVVVLPIKKDSVLLIKQYRPAVKKWILELPAGTIEKGETPEQTARRELEEETGYVPGILEKMIEFYTSPGISNEILYLFLAKNLRKTRPRRERGELIEERWFELESALKLVENNVIEDAKTIISLLYYDRVKNSSS